jgi:hypothetical protein
LDRGHGPRRIVPPFWTTIATAFSASGRATRAWRTGPVAAAGSSGRGGTSGSAEGGPALRAITAITAPIVAPLRFALELGIPVMLGRFLGPGWEEQLL